MPGELVISNINEKIRMEKKLAVGGGGDIFLVNLLESSLVQRVQSKHAVLKRGRRKLVFWSFVSGH